MPIRIPTRLRHFPALVRQNLQKHRLARLPVRERTFHLCYFNFRPYFKYLYCSLHSLTAHAANVRFKVHVFNDEENPMSAAQIAAVQALVPGTEVVSWPKSPGWGHTQIGHIWRAYARVAAQAADNDFVARVDSDVFFFNDTIFRAATNSDADLIGDGHFDDFEWVQGGCYLFTAAAVRKVAAEIEAVGLPALLAGMPTVADDRATRVLADRLGLKTWMTWFIMFPDELRNAGRLDAWSRWKFSCLHSINKNKDLMLAAYERELYGGQVPEGYRLALATP